MTTHTFRIGVLMGGKSIEREVSFNSGRTICDHLDTQRYIIIPIFQTETGKLYILPQHFLHRGKIADFSARLDQEATAISWDTLKKIVDFVYLAVHGRYGEDGTMQGMLEVMGIPYLGAKVLGSALGMDKAIQKSLLTSQGIDVARSITLTPSNLENITADQILVLLKEQGLQLPVVVKPVHEGSSFGITLVDSPDDLLQAVVQACIVDMRRKQSVLIEEKLEGMEFVCVTLERTGILRQAPAALRQAQGERGLSSAHGEELRPSRHSAGSLIPPSRRLTAMAGRQDERDLSGAHGEELRSSVSNHTNKKSWFALPLTEVIIEQNSQIFDYEQKYMPGRALKITPARCSDNDRERIVAACKKASEILQFRTISRIDGFLTNDGRVVIVDPNSLTGMSPATFLFNQAAEYGMSHTDLINFLIEHELKSYGMIDDDTFTQKLMSESMTDQAKKIRVAVLLGGDSRERETSLESGRNVCYKLSPHKYEAIPLFVNDTMELFRIDQKLLIKNSTVAIAQLVSPELQIEWSDLPTLCDFVFIGLHGGKGENGAVQGALEMLDMPYNGPGVLASALCIDKFKANNFLRDKGFHVPKNCLITKESWQSCDQTEKETFVTQQLVAHDLAIPLVIKPHDDGCSVMVQKATTIQQLCEILDVFFASEKQIALLEELIIGTELTVGVIGNDTLTVLPPSLAIAQNGILSMQEKFLPGAGENQTPAPLPTSVLEMVKNTVGNVFTTIGCKGYSRIDCFYQDAAQCPTGQDRVVILEINTVPALTPATCLFHQAAEIGIKPMDLIDKIIELGFQLHRQQHLDQEVSAQQNLFVASSPDDTQDPEAPAPKKVRREEADVQAKSSELDLMMKLF